MQLLNYLGKQNKFKKRQKARVTIRQIENQIRLKLINPKSIYWSMFYSQNKELTSCVLGPTCSATKFTKNKKENIFYLRNPTSDNNYSYFSGTDKKEIYYNTNGIRCNTKPQKENTDISCIFKLRTYFYATCMSAQKEQLMQTIGAPELNIGCQAGAKKIHVSFQIMQLDNAKQDHKIIRKFPKKMQFFTLLTKNILGSKFNSKCNPHAIISGFSPTGSPKCVCRGKYIESDQSNHKGPVCIEIEVKNAWKCEENEVFVGFADFGAANCKPPKEAYTCKSYTGRTKCPATQWLMVYNKFGNMSFDIAESSKIGSNCEYNCRVGGSGRTCNYQEKGEKQRACWFEKSKYDSASNQDKWASSLTLGLDKNDSTKGSTQCQISGDTATTEEITTCGIRAEDAAKSKKCNTEAKGVHCARPPVLFCCQPNYEL